MCFFPTQILHIKQFHERCLHHSTTSWAIPLQTLLSFDGPIRHSQSTSRLARAPWQGRCRMGFPFAHSVRRKASPQQAIAEVIRSFLEGMSRPWLLNGLCNYLVFSNLLTNSLVPRGTLCCCSEQTACPSFYMALRFYLISMILGSSERYLLLHFGSRMPHFFNDFRNCLFP